jgi:transposase
MRRRRGTKTAQPSASQGHPIPDETAEKMPQNAVPNGLIDDRTIELVALFLVAFRAAQGPTFALNMTHVQQRFGIGATAFQKAVRQLKRSGWYDRRQPRRGRKKQFAQDRIVERRDGRSGYLISHARWFDRVASEEATAPVSVKAMALWLFMRSHAATYRVSLSTIERRFGISRQTAGKLIEELEAADMVWRMNGERAAGRFTVAEYTAHPLDASALNLPTTVLPAADFEATHSTQSTTSNKNHPKENNHQQVSQADDDELVDFDPDAWIGTHSYFEVYDEEPLQDAAAIPLDDNGLQLIKRANVAKRLKNATNGQIHHKLLTRTGLKGLWTLVQFVHRRDPWLTQQEALDHVIDVAGQVTTENNRWVNGWALVGIELDANAPPFQKGQPSWLDHLRTRARNLGMGAHFSDELLEDRDGLMRFLAALEWDQAAIDNAFDAGLAALQAKGERQGDGPWSATHWSWFERCHRWQQSRDQVTAQVAADVRLSRFDPSMWFDLEGFAGFLRKARSLENAQAAITRGVAWLDSEGHIARRWSFFADHLAVAA